MPRFPFRYFFPSDSFRLMLWPVLPAAPPKGALAFPQCLIGSKKTAAHFHDFKMKRGDYSLPTKRLQFAEHWREGEKK
ncbi:MAG: hypothetical protein DYG96_13620 [Chlorobi bacterium CHB2]|nr:hypothetical protein [Chlorobi bacterium CHB2]